MENFYYIFRRARRNFANILLMPSHNIEPSRGEDAIRRTGGRHLMIGPGCVTRIATPESHYRAAVDAVRGNQMPTKRNSAYDN